MEKDIRIAVIGLGYVGLPLFCLISNHFTCKGLDNDSNQKKALIIVNVKNVVILYLHFKGGC